MTANFNKLFFKTLMVIALAPAALALVVGNPPIGIIVVLVCLSLLIPSFRPLAWTMRQIGNLFSGLINMITSLIGGVFRIIGAIFGGVFKLIGGILKFVFGGMFAGAGWLFTGGSSGPSRFMGWWERSWLLSSSHGGFLVDGRSSRLSETASYENVLVQGGVGKGKSSVFVMPNLLSPPASKPSFVILDTSGEIYQHTSGHLSRSGYQIRALNLMNTARSETYNPLARMATPQHVAELAKTLIRSANPGARPSDPFWEQAAEKLIRVLTQCLLNHPDPQFRNLANLRQLVTGFDAHIAPKGQLGKIDQYVLTATQADPGTFASYQAFVQGNFKTIQSVLMSADVALDPLATPEMAALTATNSIRFEELRQGPTALYVMVNQTQMALYAFLLNLFYAELFRELLRDPHNPGRPVWLMLDEFGHLQVDGFGVFATTARKYKVGFALFLQSLAQLEGRYGRDDAKTIRESLGTEIYLPGMGLDTAREIEARLGRTSNAPLMPASEIIRMKENEALMLHSNRLPVMLKTRRYFKRGDLRTWSRKASARLPSASTNPPPLIQL